MNHNNNNNDNHRWSSVLKFIICLVIVGSIFYLKYSSDEQQELSPSPRSNVDNKKIAVPDTSVTPGLLPVTTDTIVPSTLPDTVLGKDKRLPYEAGYEDGYTTGCDDGSRNSMKATYDESNNFHTEKEQKEYIRGYQEGYEEGYNDGKNKKQFNI